MQLVCFWSVSVTSAGEGQREREGAMVSNIEGGEGGLSSSTDGACLHRIVVGKMKEGRLNQPPLKDQILFRR